MEGGTGPHTHPLSNSWSTNRGETRDGYATYAPGLLLQKGLQCGELRYIHLHRGSQVDLVRLVNPAWRLFKMPRLQRGARAEALDHDGGVVHTTTQLNLDPFHRCLAQGEHRELRRAANADVQTLGRQRVVLDARAGQVEPDQGQ